MGELPVIPGKLFYIPKNGSSSFKPIKLKRDDHLMIVKHKETATARRIKTIIDIIIRELKDDKLVNVGELMKKWTSTLAKQTRTHQRILELSLDTPSSTETKTVLGTVFEPSKQIGHTSYRQFAN